MRCPLDVADDSEDGDLRNWLPPKHPQDHGKHAGATQPVKKVSFFSESFYASQLKIECKNM